MIPDSKDILVALEACKTEEDTKRFFETYLGKKGSVNSLFKELGSLSPEEKKEKGAQIKKLFDEIQTAFFAKQDNIKKQYRNEKLEKEIVDIQTEGGNIHKGYANLQETLRRHIEQIFQGMGFAVEYGHHLVTPYENFESVNIPLTHPATEMHDTLYVEEPGSNESLVMRTHTSAHQNELIKKLGPECKFIIPGKCYRNENMDTTHDVAFRQVEGVVIGKGITLGHFKHTMEKVLEAILETNAIELRMRPAYFPFVEPGVEIDAKIVKDGSEKWLEILGAGMIHPQVLIEAGLDPKEYSGFAFGLGLTRLVSIKYGIGDIRLFTNNDIRFLRSFENATPLSF